MDNGFAVVREDPRIERSVVGEADVGRALLVASGGCTALSLGAWFPQLELTLVDSNAAQLELVRSKISLLRAGLSDQLLRRFNVGDDGPCAATGHDAPQRRGVHMFCTPSDDRLDRALRRAGRAPVASTTVVHVGMDDVDWSFVLTSDI